uniref:DUF485 domain-containing protein n=1 Tax=Phytohalomonas tamaricis TaxID=2081032 RepID=UPI000D0ACEDE|nr:DUF485 domain-containing protein [Phytohalomonas tamaricis]
MHEEAYRQIERNPRFQELVSKRGKFAWTLALLMLGLYIAFILLIAFVPHWLGTPITASTVITWGIPLGIGLIVAAIALTGIYVRRANGEFDRLTKAILDEVKL